MPRSIDFALARPHAVTMLVLKAQISGRSSRVSAVHTRLTAHALRYKRHLLLNLAIIDILAPTIIIVVYTANEMQRM